MPERPGTLRSRGARAGTERSDRDGNLLAHGLGDQLQRLAEAGAALQRHLGYPSIPRPKRQPTTPLFEPQIEMRFQRLESKIAMLEAEQKGGLDLSQFYLDLPAETPNPEDEE